ncbi:MAG TPA: C39 family peptidase [Prosthecobacter sp.]|nr:C39 family peptidase [Prosthecobacter sp.]
MNRISPPARTAPRGPYILDPKTRERLLPEPLPHPVCGRANTLDLPGYRQMDAYSCGFVAGAMVLRCFHPRRSLRRFFDLCQPHYDTGISTTALIAALRASGVGVSTRRDLTFARIVKALDAGYPIITVVHTPVPNVDHWVVVYGYGRSPNRLFVAGDGLRIIGARGSRKEVDWETFQQTVWAYRRLGLVCWGK